MRRYASFSLALLSVLVAVGCGTVGERAEPARKTAAVEAAPSFTAALWDGRSAEGRLAWPPGGPVTVGTTDLEASRIKSINATAAAAAPEAVDATELPEGYGPLEREALQSYRRRAQEAAERHKGTDAIFCLDKGEDVLLEDGSSVYRYHALLLILKDSARSHANISLSSREGRSRARVLFARVVGPDGSSRWAERSDFTVSVPPQEARFFDKRRRVLSGQIPGAQVGMFVEYAYEHERYNPEIKDFFFPGYYFQSDIPVLDSAIDVLVPEGRPLNYTTRNMPEDSAVPKRFSTRGYDAYRWEMHDLAPVEAEPLMPPRSDIAPSMHGSLYFEWKDLMASIGAFQRERLAVTPEVAELAGKLTAGKETDDEKVAAIYHWVQRNINYLSIKASLSSGWAGHPAAETLENGYGDCTDVSNLVASLCRASGIDAYPAAIKTNDAGTAVTDIPMPDANHAITLVYPDGKPRFIDATTTDYRYPYFRADDHGVKAVIDMTEEILDVPVAPPEDNMRESTQEVKMLPGGGAEVVDKNTYTGSYEAGVRGYWRSVPPEMHGRVMQQYLQQRIPGALLAGFELAEIEDLDKQLGMTIRYRIPVFGTRVKDLHIFTLPGFQQRFPETALAERVFDIVTTTTLGYSTRVTVALPEGYELAGVPQDLAVDGKHLFFQGVTTPSDDGGNLSVAMLYRRLTRIVPASDYAEFRKNAAAIAAWTDLKIVLRKTRGVPEEEVVQ